MASGNRNKYGNIMNLHPTGASDATARQDKLAGGLQASQTMVTTDLGALNGIKHMCDRVGHTLGVHPALVGALASRESRGGALLRATGGYGDHGKAYGILQADIKHSGLEEFGLSATSYGWDTYEHMEMMIRCIFLEHKVKRIQNKFPGWSKDRQLQGAVAAYNMGEGNVRTWENVDGGTTGRDYSNDVIARAQHLVKLGWK